MILQNFQKFNMQRMKLERASGNRDSRLVSEYLKAFIWWTDDFFHISFQWCGKILTRFDELFNFRKIFCLDLAVKGQ